MKKERRKFSAAFKAKVVIEAPTGKIQLYIKLKNHADQMKIYL